MKTWDDWSDFDINRCVAKVMGLVQVRKARGSESAVQIGGYRNYDWCNSWADIGQVMENNFISIEMHGHGSRKRVYGYSDSGLCEYYANGIGYIKRASAIVFLMMNGVKP